MSHFIEKNWNKSIRENFEDLIVYTEFIKIDEKDCFVKFVGNLTGAISSDDSC